MEIQVYQSKTVTPDSREDLLKASQALEAQFLAEMLKTADVGSVPDLFGGGSGEEQFSSLLVDEQAKRLVDAGGIGLAEHLFNSLIRREANDG
ncbi:rod-binding protein [Aestuariibius sp. 2305UL40-4]|uniref:rod-binding protein n=1 Tax=Aestuariibius violaceus TaxID=3234132 RepID=UPI00345F0FE5